MRLKFTLPALALVVIALFTPACAAKGIRNQTRVGALTVGEAVLSLNDAEKQVAAANIPGYGPAEQKTVGAKLLVVIRSARTYEMAAASWKADGTPIPDQLVAARAALLQALDELAQSIPAVANVKEPLSRAVNAVRALLTPSTSARWEARPPVKQAGMPTDLPTGVVEILQSAALIGALISSGRSSWAKIKAALQKEGATDEELAALDARLGGAEAERVAQQNQQN